MFQMWRAYKKGIMPRAGGWEDQPLNLLVHFGAFTLTENTWNYMDKEGSAWDALSKLQRDLRLWVEA